MDTYLALSGLSLIVLVSYVFNWISGKTKIPSVLLLMAMGAGLKPFMENLFPGGKESIGWMLGFTGTLGLVFIVLEASLDLGLAKKKIGTIRKAFNVSFAALVVTAAAISAIFVFGYGINIASAIAYAIPLSVISSAIAIPASINLPVSKREFVVYESTFSDILGILAFNYFVLAGLDLPGTIFRLVEDFSAILLLVFLFILVMLLAMHYVNSNLKLIPILAALLAAYSAAKIVHLPALLLVLVFGLVLRNIGALKHLKWFLNMPKLDQTTDQLKTIVVELSFLIRTFFFTLFGYTLSLSGIEGRAFWLGALVFAVIMVARQFALYYLLKNNFVHELMMGPRGLVTVILFFSIPENLKIAAAGESVVYLVVILSNFAMMVLFLFYKEPYRETPSMLAGN
ncbi:MAG TPA: cation:proton antiporter [Candidatus Paceibacterota bacterium]|nr:cation:proton antiporter [Candidatus Pacearchaeota archaeon]HRZ51061.1 cation:proton antiporter [Candidatus Paceibacterota bacterium]HSA36780.1 cation:proton antiporter [Candidatus Paceibacterota bacterium]